MKHNAMILNENIADLLLFSEINKVVLNSVLKIRHVMFGSPIK